MKVLGVKQFHQMRFKFLPLGKSPFAATMGKIPFNFIAVVYGFSGNGKTEFCMQLAKELCKFGKVGWLSYEQRHGSDLQEATRRNNMDEVSGNFYPIDPISNIPDGVGLLEDLDNYLKKRNAPDFIFIDSLDYTGFSFEDYVYLKNKYGGRKAFIFISHSSKSGALKKAVSERIVFDGGLGIFVSKYIATPDKNRYGGFEPFVVWEERARLLNPLHFAKQVKEKKPKKEKKNDKIRADIGEV
jgi:hypothetical protein